MLLKLCLCPREFKATDVHGKMSNEQQSFELHPFSTIRIIEKKILIKGIEKRADLDLKGTGCGACLRFNLC